MAVLNKIQSGTATIAFAGLTVTVSLGTAIDSTKAFLWFSSYGDSYGQTTGGRLAISGYITTSSSQLVFTRQDTGGSDITIKWYVVEFSSGVSVQRGTATNVNASTSDISITSVTLSRSWAQSSIHGAYGWEWGSRQMNTAYLPDSTHIRLKALNDTNTNTVHWEVIDYDTATVQTVYTGTLPGGTASGTISLSSTVDLTKTIIVGNQFNPESSFGSPEFETHWWLSATVINWRRENPYQDRDYAFQVVTLPGIRAQRGRGTFSTAQTSNTSSIGSTLSDTTKCAAHLTEPAAVIGKPSGAESDFNRACTGLSIASTTNMQINRHSPGGSYTYDVEWELIEYLASRVPDITLFASAMY